MVEGKRSDRSYSGILNVAKPTGMTSHDVVNRVRRAAGMRRVGHAGTLDPEASGVLLVCLGVATRLSEYLMSGTKRYRAGVRFGAVSTTDDAAGTITPTPVADGGRGIGDRERGMGEGGNRTKRGDFDVNRGSAESLSLEEVRAALDRFVGEIQQVPPAYAAIKVGGEPLYRKARAGVTVEVPPRTVRIDRLDVVAWEPPDLTLDVTCSKGTYIRALARDLGQALGTGAYLSSLVRTRSSQFDVADAVPLDEVERAAALGYLGRLLHPLDAAVSHLPAFVLAPEAVGRVRSGARWDGPAAESELARAYDPLGRLIALVRWDGGGWQPDKVFPEECAGDVD